MAMKDISDREVLQAYENAKFIRLHTDTMVWPYEILQRRTGQPEKVCYRCMERAVGRGLIDYGVSIRSGWVTDKGKALLTTCGQNTDKTL